MGVSIRFPKLITFFSIFLPPGESVCVHVHVVFPYIVIPFTTSPGENNDYSMLQLAKNIDEALNKRRGSDKPAIDHVYKIAMYKAR